MSTAFDSSYGYEPLDAQPAVTRASGQQHYTLVPSTAKLLNTAVEQPLSLFAIYIDGNQVAPQGTVRGIAPCQPVVGA